MLKSILRKTKKIIEKKLIKYIVWDFDDTLYVNLKLGTKLKKCYLDYLNEKSKENISFREFNLLTKNGLSWSGLVAKKLKKSENFVPKPTSKDKGFFDRMKDYFK